MDKRWEKLAVELRHSLHRHPELSLEEHWTKQHLMHFLKQHTKLEVVDCGAWFYAHCKGKQPSGGIAFRAEMDALPVPDEIEKDYVSQFPGKGHKCGHDGHQAALCGLALELSEKGADRDVYLIFQHGEEIGAGGGECARLLAEKGIQEVYGWHNRPGMPKGMVQTMDGTMYYASKGMIRILKAHLPMPACRKRVVALPLRFPALSAPFRDLWLRKTGKARCSAP